MQSPKKTPRTRIVAKKQEMEVLEESTPKRKSQKERKENFQPFVIPTYSPKELNDKYVETVRKSPKEKLKAKMAKQEWKRNKKLNAIR